MKIERICTHGVVTADQSRTLRECAALMGERHVGTVLVTEDTPTGAQAIGIVTDRDLVVKAMAHDLSAGTTHIGEIATRRLVTVFPDAAVDDAIDLMQREGVRRLLVADADRRLLGIVSMDDLLDMLAGEVAGIVKAIRGAVSSEAARIHPGCELCGERSVRLPA